MDKRPLVVPIKITKEFAINNIGIEPEDIGHWCILDDSVFYVSDKKGEAGRKEIQSKAGELNKHRDDPGYHSILDIRND